MSLELYTKRLNEIVRPTGNVKEQLLSAIKDIEAKIEHLKEIVSCSFLFLCNLIKDLSFRKLWDLSCLSCVWRSKSSYGKVVWGNIKKSRTYGGLNSQSIPLARCSISSNRRMWSPNKAVEDLGIRWTLVISWVISLLFIYILSVRSGVLSARIINDKDILIESIKQYFSFLNTQLSTDPDILPSILEQSQQHKTCLDSLLYLMT